VGNRARRGPLESAAVIRAGLALAAVVVFAGCGGGTHGRATVWVTRDEGRHELVVRTVPAGETALQALERSAKITTRYGGRFVESIDGIAGSLSSRHDWFYFVNGIEADRGAAEYVLHPGDVEWWDYRDWGAYGESVPMVVGAYPEPFLHGYDGKSRPTDVAYVLPSSRGDALRIAKQVHARKVVGPTGAVGSDSNRIVIAAQPSELASIAPSGTGPHTQFELDLGWKTAARLAADPNALRFQYGSPP
jgi:Domain of unknown function (DUF4430)